MRNLDLGYYILDNQGNPQKCDDYAAWRKWFQSRENRFVAETVIDDVRVATDFLGMDWNSEDPSLPILYETEISGGKFDGYIRRWRTKLEAIKGHEETVQMIAE